MKRIPAYRFSSFGDVILTIPVIVSFLSEHRDTEIVFFTRTKFVPYFPKNDRLTVIGVDLDNTFSGLKGLLKLSKLIRHEAGKNRLILDFHHVLRTRIINTVLSLSGYKVIKLQKSRKKRKQYISGQNRSALPGVLQLYSNVFYRAGFEFPILDPPFIGTNESFDTELNTPRKIGIAPFSKHRTKTWPFENMMEVKKIVEKEISSEFYLFGSKSEIDSLSKTDKENFTILDTNSTSEEEIALIRSLDLMISMDSANMHLADIMKVPVISIWGGTHPDLGFKPSFQNSNRLISSELNFECRPCSVFGKETCKLTDTPFACLSSISPEMVAKRVLAEL